MGELLSSTLAVEKSENRHCLLKIISALKFLARQACGIRGSGDECDGNFNQLLKLHAADDPKVINFDNHACIKF